MQTTAHASAFPTRVSIDELPPDFTTPAAKYRRQAWLALIALLVFGVAYISLAVWFSYTSYRLLSRLADGEGVFASLAAGIPAGFLAIFMWKALFFKRQKAGEHLIEVKQQEEPELFEFLYDLADRVKAPRPHRVFLSAEVNAAVFYDLTLFNFILPTKKNLIIGLGLVNALNRHEFEAVLAHEFGHFAQKTMAVGRWAAFAEQIARQIVTGRDALDSLLMTISAIDIRIAWVGWIMRTIVWSIRSLIETLFGWVTILQRALSQEMEFQADLVAVSATGSDGLVNGLYRCQTADENWQQALGFAERQANEKKKIADVFSIQSRANALLARIIGEPDRGRIPPASDGDLATRRVFTRQLAQPPKMWATHPSNVDREENAKRIYVSAPTDDRPAWSVFQDPEQLRRRVTAHLLRDLPKDFELQQPEESLREFEAQFEQPAFDARYQGLYLGRRVTLAAESPREIFGEPPTPDELPQLLANVYDESLHDLLDKARNLSEHVVALESVQAGMSDASSDSFEYEGENYTRRQLPKLIERVQADAEAVKRELSDCDRRIRTAYNAAARHIGSGWQEYHTALAGLLHYAEHSEADLEDALGHFSNTVAVATATGRVSGRSLKRVLESADDLHHVMHSIDRQAVSVHLPAAVSKELKVATWREKLPKIELPGPTRENIGQWVDAVGSWAGGMLAPLSELRQATLNHLLLTEYAIQDMRVHTEDVPHAPDPAQPPEFYSVRPPGSERKRQTKLDWLARFAVADGIVPMVARTGVAASILGGVIAAGVMTGHATVVVYNGLGTLVRVDVEGKQVQLGPGDHQRVWVSPPFDSPIRAYSGEYLVEEFKPAADRSFGTYVYTVAASAPLVELTAVYGNVSPRSPKVIGFKRWLRARTDYVFEDPPSSIETKEGGTTRSVLDKVGDLLPFEAVSLARIEAQRSSAIAAHVLWDDSGSQNYSTWLGLSSTMKDGFEVLNERLQRDPENISVLRALQETVPEGQRDALLAEHRQLAQTHPDDAGMQYISIRAMDDGAEQDEAFLRAAEKWPENVYLAYAAAYVQCGRQNWQAANQLLEVILAQRGNPMFDGAAVEAARIRRLLAAPETADLGDLMHSRVMRLLYDLEIGHGTDGSPARIFSMMHRREFEAAYRVANSSQASPSMLVLLAASRGTPAEWDEEALQIPVESLDDVSTCYYLAALAKLAKGDVGKYLDTAEALTEPRDIAFHQAIEAVIRAEGQGDLRPYLQRRSTAQQGQIYAVATMLRGAEAPAEWRNASQALLFANEVPVL